MTRQLMALASGRVLIALEGGYNLASISAATVACTSALLGEAAPPAPAETVPTQLQPNTLALANEVLDRVIRIHHKYWPALELPRERARDDELVDAMQGLALDGDASGTADGICNNRLADHGLAAGRCSLM
jgi:hypothetical protein